MESKAFQTEANVGDQVSHKRTIPRKLLIVEWIEVFKWLLLCLKPKFTCISPAGSVNNPTYIIYHITCHISYV